MTMLRKHHGEHSVYPGHPSTVALEIMLAYKGDLETALGPCYDRDGNKLSFCDAVGSTEVSGGGGAVRQGVDLVRYVQTGVLTPLEALDYGDLVWGRGRNWGQSGGDHPSKFQEGQEQADRFKHHLLEWLFKVEVTPREDRDEVRTALLGQMARKFAWK